MRLRDRRSQYILFGGHRGCGKSTELRALSRDLAGINRYFVVFVDALMALDINNLRYSDIALAPSEALINRLNDENIDVPDIYIDDLVRSAGREDRENAGDAS